MDYSVAWPALQARLWEETEHAAFGRRSAVVRTIPPREVYHPSGKLRQLALHASQVELSPREELDARGLRPADVLNPDRTVFDAVERALEVVQQHALPLARRVGGLRDAASHRRAL